MLPRIVRIRVLRQRLSSVSGLAHSQRPCSERCRNAGLAAIVPKRTLFAPHMRYAVGAILLTPTCFFPARRFNPPPPVKVKLLGMTSSLTMGVFGTIKEIVQASSILLVDRLEVERAHGDNTNPPLAKAKWFRLLSALSRVVRRNSSGFLSRAAFVCLACVLPGFQATGACFVLFTQALSGVCATGNTVCLLHNVLSLRLIPASCASALFNDRYC